jgi:trigger factor
MNVEIEKPKSYIRELKISLPFEDYEREKSIVVRQLQGTAEIPGFRKGKTPLSIIENKFKKEIEKEAKDTLLKNAFIQALKENNLNPISFADISEISIPQDKGEISFRVRFQVVPEFTLTLKGIETRYSGKKVLKKEIEEGLRELQKKFTTVRPTTRSAKIGDIVEFDYEVFEGKGEKVDSTQGMTMECRKPQSKKSIHSLLLGAKPKVSSEGIVLYPQEFPKEELTGREVSITLTVQEVKEKFIPEINDEFARMLGLESEKDLRESLKKQLDEENERREKRAAMEKLIEKLAKKNDFEVPDALIRYYTKLEKDRMGEKEIEGDELRKLAERRARLNILLDRIAENEKIEVPEREMDDFIRDEATRQSVSYEELRTYLNQSGKIDDFITITKREKAYDLLQERYLKKE